MKDHLQKTTDPSGLAESWQWIWGVAQPGRLHGCRRGCRGALQTDCALMNVAGVRAPSVAGFPAIIIA
jgi:hypothetical protein